MPDKKEPKTSAAKMLKTLAMGALLATSGSGVPSAGRKKTNMMRLNALVTNKKKLHLENKHKEEKLEIENFLRPNALSLALEKGNNYGIFDIHDGMSKDNVLQELLGKCDGDKYMDQKPKKLGEGVLGAAYLISTKKGRGQAFIRTILDAVSKDTQIRSKTKESAKKEMENLVISRDEKVWAPKVRDSFVLKVSYTRNPYLHNSTRNFVNILEQVNHAPAFTFDTKASVSLSKMYKDTYALRVQDFTPRLVAGFTLQNAPGYHFTIMEAIHGHTVAKFQRWLDTVDENDLMQPKMDIRSEVAHMVKKAHLAMMLTMGLTHNDLHLNNMMVRVEKNAAGKYVFSVVIIDLSEAKVSEHVKHFSRHAFKDALQNIDFSFLSLYDPFPGDLPYRCYHLVHKYIMERFKDVAKAAKNSQHFLDFLY
jgi:tRNA A-37 threonylcarbamoyl transferase component Bud32